MAVRRQHQGSASSASDARQRWRTLRWFILPLAEMEPEVRELAERIHNEVERLSRSELTDEERVECLLSHFDRLEPLWERIRTGPKTLRQAAEHHVEALELSATQFQRQYYGR